MNAVLFTELCVARAQDHTDLPVKMVGSYLVPPCPLVVKIGTKII